MRLHSRALHSHSSSAQAIHSPLPRPPQRRPRTTVSAHQCRLLAPIAAAAAAAADAPPLVKDNPPLSRRGLTVGGSLLPLLLGALSHVSPAQATDDDIAPDGNESNRQQAPALGPGCGSENPTKKAFLDVSIDGQPAGRIVVGLYGAEAPAGAARFVSLVTGAAGISYRRKEFVKIAPNYIQHGGVRSYGVDAELAKQTGSELAANDLVSEWDKAREEECRPGTKNVAGVLGLVVRDPAKPPPKLKLVARRGKLEMDEEEIRADPNGTEFVITTKDSPELDASTLVVGHVLEGMEVVEKISKVKAVRENTSSPYFRVAKLIGDKRAVVAERGFSRPYSKVIITNCGLIE